MLISGAIDVTLGQLKPAVMLTLVLTWFWLGVFLPLCGFSIVAHIEIVQFSS